MELIACTGEAAQAQALEAVMDLQVREAHFNLLALVTGFGELGRRHRAHGRDRGLASLRSRVTLACGVFGQHLDLSGQGRQSRVRAGSAACSRHRTLPVVVSELTRRTDIDVALFVECEVGT